MATLAEVREQGRPVESWADFDRKAALVEERFGRPMGLGGLAMIVLLVFQMVVFLGKEYRR